MFTSLILILVPSTAPSQHMLGFVVFLFFCFNKEMKLWEADSLALAVSLLEGPHTNFIYIAWFFFSFALEYHLAGSLVSFCSFFKFQHNAIFSLMPSLSLLGRIYCSLFYLHSFFSPAFILDSRGYMCRFVIWANCESQGVCFKYYFVTQVISIVPDRWFLICTLLPHSSRLWCLLFPSLCPSVLYV